MAENAEVVRILNAIADLLDLAGEKFKPEAYRRAARSIEALPENLRRIAQRGQLNEIPGVGEAIGEKIREFLRTGQISYYEKLQRQFPAGILELMQLPGIGPKTARRFLVELNIEGPAELAQALDQGRLSGLKGFGPKKLELFRAALTQTATVGKRTPLRQAAAIAEEIMDGLRSQVSLDRVAMAGSFRRRRESVGDLDVLATSPDPDAVLTAFTHLPGVTAVKLQGGTKATVVYRGGMQIDLRVVEPPSFGAALQYFTGSKDHNVHLRTIARDRGLKINEYGVFRGEERIGGATEEEVYATLGLPTMPPEIRENHGEIEAAMENRLPRLVDVPDLKGDLHVHLASTATSADVEAVMESARTRGDEYVGIVLPTASHPDSGLDPAVRRRIDHWRETPGSQRPRLLLAEERTTFPKPNTRRATETAFDYWIWNVRAASDVPAPKRPPDDRPLVIAHFHSEAAKGTPIPLDRWIAWARSTDAALEVTSDGPADGLESSGVLQVRQSEVPLLLSAGVEGTTPARIDLAVGLARRGWAGPKDVLNTRALKELLPR